MDDFFSKIKAAVENTKAAPAAATTTPDAEDAAWCALQPSLVHEVCLEAECAPGVI